MSTKILILTLGLVLLTGCQQSTKPDASEGVPVRETLPTREMSAPSDLGAPDPEPAAEGNDAPAAEPDPAEMSPAADEPSVQADPPPTPSKSTSQKPPATPVKHKGTPYGGEVTGTPMAVQTFLEQATALEGEIVTLEGVLGHVCDMGCWFFLTDPDARTESGQPVKIYIDLQGGAVFTIPNTSAGKRAVVQGRVAKNNNGWKLIGRGVVLS